jgi:hypothetical protein
MFSKKNSFLCTFNDDIYVTLLFGCLLLCVFKVPCSIFLQSYPRAYTHKHSIHSQKIQKKLMRVYL